MTFMHHPMQNNFQPFFPFQFLPFTFDISHFPVSPLFTPNRGSGEAFFVTQLSRRNPTQCPCLTGTVHEHRYSRVVHLFISGAKMGPQNDLAFGCILVFEFTSLLLFGLFSQFYFTLYFLIRSSTVSLNLDLLFRALLPKQMKYLTQLAKPSLPLLPSHETQPSEY